MYKYQSAPVQTPNADMKFLHNGRAVWNLTRSTINHQSPNALIKLMPTSYSTKKSKKDGKDSGDGDKPYRPQQQNLLPYHVLPLEETLPRFMATVQPHLTEEEFQEQEKITKDFECEEGEKLQALLEEAGSATNWLAPRWLCAAYLQYRDPVTVYVSPCMTFPRQEFKDKDEYLDYTGKVIFGLGEFKNIVDDGKIPIIKMGENELDNGQFGFVFGTCRIPVRITDKLVYNPCNDYVVVIYKNYFYKMSLYNKSSRLLSASSISRQLCLIMKAEEKCPMGPPIGILTTDTRDNWAEAYEQMSKLPGNVDAMKIIQGALFTVSLDQMTTADKGQEFNHLALQLIHGGGSKMNSANRWMDKTIQLVVNPNGNVGFTYEHSPAEGQPIAMMMDYVVKNMLEDEDYGECGAKDEDMCPEKIKFCPMNPCIEQWLYVAERNIDKLVFNLQMNVMKYECFGKNFIKSQKLGPDSFIQMALQLAFYKMHKVPAAQYESAHLRIFEDGRTETIRSCSIESVAFCKAMTDKEVPAEQRAALLRKAVTAHQAYTKLALQGHGVDRHLLGLKLMALENDMAVPEFFSSKGYVKSMNYRMSTSQVATMYEAFMGYGPATEDGYGCCYNPRDNDIILAISAWRKNQQTDPVKFGKALEDAFMQMQDTLEEAEPDEPPKEEKEKKPKSKL